MLLQGIFPAITTPFYPDGRLYLKKLEHNVDRYSRTPISGMVVLGSTGETVMLSDDEQRSVLKLAIEVASAEKVMVAGVGQESTFQTLLLIDYAAKGETVELAGVEPVEGHSAYKLKVTDKNGYARHVWVDAENFLEVKVEGTPRRLDGKYHPVATYLRDYRSVNGLMMPYLEETVAEGVKDREKIVIEEIVSNPKLDESRFAMPR